jgi:hypothetical protein
MSFKPEARYSRNGFNLGYMCNSLAGRGVLEENLISFTEEVGLAKESRPGTCKYLFSRGLKHAGAIAGLGLGGLLFAFIPDLADGSVNLSLGFYTISSLFGIVAGYCDWYSEYENNVPHELESPKKKAREFRSMLYTDYQYDVLRIIENRNGNNLEEVS